MFRTAAILVTCLLAAAPALAQPPTYTVTGMGNGGLEGAFASGLSENGQVVGYAYTLDATTQQFSQMLPYVYSQGVMTPLPAVNGLAFRASGINDAGQIVGFSYTVDAASGAQIYQRALLLGGGQALDLGTLGGTRARARAINDQGQVTGLSRVSNGGGVTHAFLYSGGAMTDLGAPAGGRSAGSAINNLGVVAGTVTLADSSTHAAVFTAGAGFIDVGSLGGSFTAVNGINDLGQVVGYSETTLGDPSAPVTHAFIVDGGVMHDLGSFAGRSFTMASDINNRGQIVGLAFDETEFDNQVFLREGNQTFDLNRLLDPARAAGWTITGVYAINDRGQIAGDGILNGVRQAVLLTPVPELPVPVLLAAGLAALSLRRRRLPAAD